MKHARFFPRAAAPAAAAAPRGAAPVGRMAELSPPEIAAITYLRMWQAGAGAEVRADFTALLGPEDGEAALQAFAALADLLCTARQPFPAHAPGCGCYGGAESAFSGLLRAAAEGDETGAAGFALHLFSGHPPPRILGLAARCGLALTHMARHLARPEGPLH